MPPWKSVEALQHMCYMVMAETIHQIAVEIEEFPDSCKMSAAELLQMVSALPPLMNENLIVKVIETIHQTVSRTRRNIGMRTCLEVLLQPHIQRLDLRGLFFQMRLPGAINRTIRCVVSDQVAHMENLVMLNMVSKCSDEILSIMGKKCPNIVEVNVSISDLVTDAGLKDLVNGCPKMEILGIYKCWEITSKGIAYVLQHGKNLLKLQSDQLGVVMIQKFRKTNTTFKLTHFDQTQTLFEPKEDDLRWIRSACPGLVSTSLFVDDETLALIPRLGNLKILEIETSAVLGTGFVAAVRELGESLTTLHINCEDVGQDKIMLLGKCCPHITTLHISTATVEGDELLSNTGQLFSSLVSLHLQVWNEAVVSRECVEFFLLWCRKLESIVLKAEFEFLNDQYLSGLLATNPMTAAKRITFASDKYVPLTVASVYRLMESCPALENLGMSSWDVTEEEFFEIRNEAKKNNYYFSIS